MASQTNGISNMLKKIIISSFNYAWIVTEQSAIMNMYSDGVCLTCHGEFEFHNILNKGIISVMTLLAIRMCVYTQSLRLDQYIVFKIMELCFPHHFRHIHVCETTTMWQNINPLHWRRMNEYIYNFTGVSKQSPMPCFGHPLERSCQQFFVQVIYSVGRPVVTMTFHRHVTVGLIATYYWLELETSPDATFRCPIENDGRTYIPSVLVDDSNHKLSSPSANARRPCKGKRFSYLPCFRFLPHDNLYQNHNKDSIKLPGNTILQICRFYPNKSV